MFFFLFFVITCIMKAPADNIPVKVEYTQMMAL